MIGGRVFDILVYELDYYREHPLEAVNWWVGGMASHGVMLGGVVGVFLFCRLRRKRFLVAADELTVPAAFLMGIGRIGNFIEGGVIGSVTAMPWGVIFPGVEGPRHPVALYDGAKNLLLVPVLILILRRWPAGRGVATGAFLFLYAGLEVPGRPLPRLRGRLARHRPGPVLQPDHGRDRPRGPGLGAPAAYPGIPFISPEPRRVNPLLVVIFVFLCLYPLGIPTSWTRENIETIRAEEPAP